jgi:hypothetical protein
MNVQQILETLKKSIQETGSAVVKNVGDSGQLEAYRTALQLVFIGRPEYRKLENGKYLFYWTGEELKKAQNQVKHFLKPNPNAITQTEFLPLIKPQIMSVAIPLSILAVLLFAKGKR